MVELLQNPVQTPTTSKWKDTTLIIIGIAGIVLLLVILQAAKIISTTIFYFSLLAIFSYPVLKAASPLILEKLKQKQLIQTQGVIHHYKNAIREILEEHHDWGYPPNYKPRIAAYLPALDYVVFEVNRADVSRQLGYNAARAVDFEGSIIYDATAKKIFDVYEGWNYEKTLAHLQRFEVYFAKTPTKILLPTSLRTTETQIGLP